MAVESSIKQHFNLLTDSDISVETEMVKLDEHFGFTSKEIEQSNKGDPRAIITWKGGESVAEERLKRWLGASNSKGIKSYRLDTKSREGCLQSSHLSAWMAIGALSVKSVYHAVKGYEKTNIIIH